MGASGLLLPLLPSHSSHLPWHRPLRGLQSFWGSTCLGKTKSLFLPQRDDTRLSPCLRCLWLMWPSLGSAAALGHVSSIVPSMTPAGRAALPLPGDGCLLQQGSLQAGEGSGRCAPSMFRCQSLVLLPASSSALPVWQAPKERDLTCQMMQALTLSRPFSLSQSMAEGGWLEGWLAAGSPLGRGQPGRQAGSQALPRGACPAQGRDSGSCCHPCLLPAFAWGCLPCPKALWQRLAVPGAGLAGLGQREQVGHGCSLLSCPFAPPAQLGPGGGDDDRRWGAAGAPAPVPKSKHHALALEGAAPLHWAWGELGGHCLSGGALHALLSCTPLGAQGLRSLGDTLLQVGGPW